MTQPMRLKLAEMRCLPSAAMVITVSAFRFLLGQCCNKVATVFCQLSDSVPIIWTARVCRALPNRINALRKETCTSLRCMHGRSRSLWSYFNKTFQRKFTHSLKITINTFIQKKISNFLGLIGKERVDKWRTSRLDFEFSLTNEELIFFLTKLKNCLGRNLVFSKVIGK